MVRTAVATVESVSLMPHFASIAVSPANTAEPQANKSHIYTPPYHVVCLYDNTDRRGKFKRGINWDGICQCNTDKMEAMYMC